MARETLITYYHEPDDRIGGMYTCLFDEDSGHPDFGRALRRAVTHFVLSNESIRGRGVISFGEAFGMMQDEDFGAFGITILAGDDPWTFNGDELMDVPSKENPNA